MEKLKDFEDYEFEDLRKKVNKNRFGIQRCSDCNVLEGDYHKENCRFEICTQCGRRLINCKHKNKERESYFHKTKFYCRCIRCGDLVYDYLELTDRQWIDIYGITYGKDDCNDLLCVKCFRLVKKLRKIK